MSDPLSAGGRLLVFAHQDEAQAFSAVPHLVTGVGKINATAELSRVLVARDVSRVTVLGTAGMLDDGYDLDTVYRIASVLQHDFSLPSPVHELRLLDRDHETLGDVPTAMIATGDVFVTDDEHRLRLAAGGAGLVDMETYAFAHVCALFEVDLQVFKIPSDFADSTTTQESWDSIVARKSDQLFAFAQSHGLLDATVNVVD